MEPSKKISKSNAKSDDIQLCARAMMWDSTIKNLLFFTAEKTRTFFPSRSIRKLKIVHHKILTT